MHASDTPADGTGEANADIAVRALWLAAGHFLLARLSETLIPQTSYLAAIWLPTGFVMGVLLLSSRRSWRVLLPVAWAAAALPDIVRGAPAHLVLAHALTGVAAMALVAAAVMPSGRPVRLPVSLEFNIRFLALGGVLAPVLIAGGGTAALLVLGVPAPPAEVWLSSMLAESASVLVVAPLTGSIADGSLWRLWRAHPLQWVGGGALLLALTWLALGMATFPGVYLLFPALAVVAWRSGHPGAALGAAVVALGGAWAVSAGSGPFAMVSDEAARVRWFQLYVCVLAVSVQLLASLVQRQRETTRELRVAEERHRRLIEISPDGVMVHRRGVIEFVNDAALRIVGAADSRQVVGRSAVEFLVEADVAPALARIAALSEAGGSAPPREYRLRRLDGAERDVEVAAASFRQRGETWVIAVVRDVTERNRAAAKLSAQAAVLSATLENMTQGISVVDGDLKVLAWNRRFVDLLELGEGLMNEHTRFEDVIRFNALRGEYGEGEVETLVRQRVELARKFLPHHLERVRPDGTVLEIVGKPLPGGGMVTTYTDITARKRAERALIQSEERFRSLTQLSSDYYWELDSEFRFRSMTLGSRSVAGFDPRAEYGRPRWEIPGLRIVGQSWEAHREMLEAHRPFRNLTLEMTTATGAQHYSLINGEPVFGEEGAFAGYRGTGSDITERVRAQQEVRRLNEELEQRVADRTAALEAAVKELEAFTYSVSHDLRAPLRAMDGFSRLLVEDFGSVLPDAGRAYLDRVRGNAQRMGQLIDDLLAFSRMARQQLKRERVDVGALVEQAIAETGSEGIEFCVGPLPPCEADPSLLRQVLVNLIANAVKYSRRNPNPRIEIGCVDGAYFVRDNGVGFDMRFADKLFEVFNRLHRSEEFEGTGVGLAIVKRVIQRHGGRVWADASPGKGATFSFSLPSPAD